MRITWHVLPTVVSAQTGPGSGTRLLIIWWKIHGFLISAVNPSDTEATSLEQSELSELARCIGSSYQTIAIEFLGYCIEEIEDLQEKHRGNIDRVKFDILNGWAKRHPEGNQRYVSASHGKFLLSKPACRVPVSDFFLQMIDYERFPISLLVDIGPKMA